jgi:enoyl-CoA hydratase/carnithine racemase
MGVASIEPRPASKSSRSTGRKKLNAIKAGCSRPVISLASSTTLTQPAATLTGDGGRAFSASADMTDLPELWRCGSTSRNEQQDTVRPARPGRSTVGVLNLQ